MIATPSIVVCTRIDELLQSQREALGDDFMGLRNHCQRVYAIASHRIPNASPDDLEQLAIAAAFHDLGIWTHRTFDYLPPSMQLASDYLRSQNREEWSAHVSTIILDHHKLTRSKHHLAEIFRKADLADISCGILLHKDSRIFFRALRITFPNAGFYRCLLRLSIKRLLSHPWSPLPMVRF